MVSPVAMLITHNDEDDQDFQIIMLFATVRSRDITLAAISLHRIFS
jgi:hypothetical protein